MSRDSATVSNNMRKIHSKDTSIELLLRKALWYKGYRYRKNYKALPGSPDIVLTKYKIAIFCDSEFFHGKDWEILKLRLEKGKNPDFWIKKIERNRNRDYENDKKLLFLGYTVLHFWGQDISKHTDECLQAIEEAIWDNYKLNRACFPVKKTYSDLLYQKDVKTIFNLKRIVQKNEFENTKKYQYTFDIDSYKNGDLLNSDVFSSTRNIRDMILKQMNEPIFYYFIETFTEQFIDNFYNG